MRAIQSSPIEQRIADDRQRLGIPPVHHARMPQPMADHIRRLMRADGFKFHHWQRSTAELLCVLQQPYGSLFDHVGQSVTADGRPCFCCEPYRTRQGVHERAQQFADRFGLQLHVAEHSWHYPGETLRFEFTLPDGDDK